MRVAIDATPLLDVRTGVGTFVREVFDRLAAQPDVELVAFGYTRLYRQELARLLPNGARITRLPVPARTTRRFWLRSNLPPIELWTGRIDVVHGPNFVVPPARRAAELVTIHDLTPVRFPELCDDNTIKYPSLIRRALDRGAHVHTVSEFVAAEVVEVFGVPEERVHAIHNGVTPVTPGSAEAGHHLAGGDRYVVAVGTIEPRKNHALLVEAFDDLAADDHEVRLAIAGGRGWRRERFECALAEAKHRDRIVELGRVTDRQLSDLLAGASALAYPSVYEGFGLPPLEAMSAGVPVVATATGALPEVLGNAAVFVPPDQASLSEALARVLTDETLRIELVARGTERVARYSWDRSASEIRRLYGQLADR